LTETGSNKSKGSLRQDRHAQGRHPRPGVEMGAENINKIISLQMRRLEKQVPEPRRHFVSFDQIRTPMITCLNRLGNILEDDLPGMVFSDRQMAFGASKETGLPTYCRECDVLFACRGGCPKHRFARPPEGEPGLNYLCTGLKRFHHHVSPYMKQLADFIRKRIPVRNVMEWARDHTACDR